jgi:hypothetical protein
MSPTVSFETGWAIGPIPDLLGLGRAVSTSGVD